MKSIYFFLVATLLALSACQKEDEGMPFDDDNPTVNVPEDTIVLTPTAYTPGDTTFGFVQAVWQDSFLWSASATARYHGSPTLPNESYFIIEFRTHETETPFNFLRESLTFTEIPKNTVGIFAITTAHGNFNNQSVFGSYATLIDGGDALEDYYEVDESLGGNQLTILEVDTVNQIYKGTFNVSFQIATTFGKQNPDNPDKMKFEDAEFWVQLQE